MKMSKWSMMLAVHSFRAVIHPCDIDTTDRPGRLEQMAIREPEIGPQYLSRNGGWLLHQCAT